ncbi:MAG: DUF6259 domain-containing protein [Planctomycetota bacterium]
MARPTFFPSVLLGACALAAAGNAQDSISNGVVTLHYDPTHPLHGVAFTSIEDGAGGVSFPLAAEPLWEVLLRHPDGTTYPLRFDDGLVAGTFSHAKSAAGDELTCTWSSLAPAAFPSDELEVRLIATAAPGADFVAFELEVDFGLGALPTATSLYRVELRLSCASPGPAAQEVLAVPSYLGMAYFDPLNNAELAALAVDAGTPTSPSPGSPAATHPGTLSMQWLAYYVDPPDGSPGPLLFWSTRDDGLNLKPYRFGLDGDSMTFGVQHYPLGSLTPARAVVSRSLPFPTVLSVRAGDWYDAARYYRDWAVQQPWTAGGTMSSDPSYSELVRDAAMIGSMVPSKCTALDPTLAPVDTPKSLGAPGGGPYDPCLTAPFDYATWLDWKAELDAMTSYFDVGSTVTMSWVWDFGGNLSRPGSWFPIRPEWAATAPAVGAAHASAPYFELDFYHPGAQGFDSSYVPGYEGQSVDAYTAKTEDGETLFKLVFPLEERTLPCGSLYCQREGPWMALCFGTDFPVDYTKFMAETLHAAGANGLFLDEYQLDPRMCYDPTHPHPEGDGSYWVAGKRALLQSVKDHMRALEPEFFLAIEGPSEMALGVVELTCNRYGGNETTALKARVPLYNTVYNDYAMVGSPIQVNDQLDAVLESPTVSLALRQKFAAHVYQGGEPIAGSLLGPKTLLDSVGLFPEYAKAAAMIGTYMRVLQDPRARDLIVFGQRLRDPQTNAQKVPWFPAELPGGIEQPLVYAALFGVPDEAAPDVALLLMNWTHPTDDPGLLPPGTPGPQAITVSFDPAEYGFQPGSTYTHRVITPQDAGTSLPFVYDGAPFGGSYVVPGNEAWVLLFETP